MSYQILQARTLDALTLLLNGGISGKTNVVGTLDLDTLTLIFTSPVAQTVTFSGTALAPEDIVAQIEAANVGLVGVPRILTTKVGTPAAGRVPQLQRVLHLSEGTSGVVITNIGTANSLLGFPTVALDPGLTGTPVDPTKIVGGGDTNSGGYYVIVSP
jgi:hypothetical protein